MKCWSQLILISRINRNCGDEQTLQQTYSKEFSEVQVAFKILMTH